MMAAQLGVGADFGQGSGRLPLRELRRAEAARLKRWVAMENDYAAEYDALAVTYLGRHLLASDALSAQSAEDAERRLGHGMPMALKTYYSVAGAARHLNLAHHRLLPPPDIVIENEFLVFMHENQSVVSWGFRVQDLSQDDPVVWQRNNTPPREWFSEDLTFTKFLESMFAWYAEAGLLVRS